MPMYLYRCTECGREVEELQKIGTDEAPPTEEPCPEGGQCTMQKVITAPSFKFIGEGWGGWEEKTPGFVQRATPGKRKTLALKKKRPKKEPDSV